MADRVIGIGLTYGRSAPVPVFGAGFVTTYFDQNSWIPTLAYGPGVGFGGGVGAPVSVDLIIGRPGVPVSSFLGTGYSHSVTAIVTAGLVRDSEGNVIGVLTGLSPSIGINYGSVSYGVNNTGEFGHASPFSYRLAWANTNAADIAEAEASGKNVFQAVSDNQIDAGNAT